MAQLKSFGTLKRVLFVCPTRQLAEQAKSRAVECGITTSSYGGRAWEGEANYRDGRRLCLTNYAAVFNGKSIFADHDVGALIFDDAHAAEPVLRDCFTLKIDRNHSVFDSLCDLIREDFTATRQSFEDAIAGYSSKTLFLPMFSALAKADRVRGHLLNAGVNTDQNTKFAWEHLKDQIEASMVCLSGRGIEFAPPVLPVHKLPYFADTVRRIRDADFKKAIELYEECANDARPHDRGLSAWYTHWEATAHARLGEQKKATDAFMRAATLANTLGWPPQHERNDETFVDVS